MEKGPALPALGTSSRMLSRFLFSVFFSLTVSGPTVQIAISVARMGVIPVSGTRTLSGFRWHHAKDRPGTMQLVPEEQHTPGSVFQTCCILVEAGALYNGDGVGNEY